MSCIVRCAAKNDLPSIIKLYCDSNYMPDRFICDKVRKTFESIISSDCSKIFVCEKNGKIISCVSITIIKSLACEARPYLVADHLCFCKNDADSIDLLIAKVKETSCRYNCFKIVFLNESGNPVINSYLSRASFSVRDYYLKN